MAFVTAFEDGEGRLYCGCLRETTEPAGKIAMSVEIVENKKAYAGWLSIWVASIRLADGRIMRREIVKHGQAACVLPYDALRRTAVLVRQLRVPVYVTAGTERLLEAIAGMVDDEDPSATARREAFEEAGLRLGDLEFVADAWPSPGFLTERVALYLARYSLKDRIGAGGGLAEEHEDIEVVELPLDEIAAMADRGELVDLKTLCLVQTLRLRHPQLFGPAP
jgi:nudix-type nucleoside diphosphatase (YffH/AdpP family)